MCVCFSQRQKERERELRARTPRTEWTPCRTMSTQERHAYAHVQAVPHHVSMDAAQHLRMWNVDLPDPPPHHFVHLAMTRVRWRISRHVTFPRDLCYFIDEEPVVGLFIFVTPCQNITVTVSITQNTYRFVRFAAHTFRFGWLEHTFRNTKARDMSRSL